MIEKLTMQADPGIVVLFGSGEISASGRKVYDWLFSRLSPPIDISILETPAGFQPNSALVAQKVGNFISHHLSNYRPQVTVIPARRRGTSLSPDDASLISPLLKSNVILMGPGSPTYAVDQLEKSLAWHTLLARHRLGASLIMASAATIAIGTYALPVYEIYKAGADLSWHPGLDLFGAYGLPLVFIPHWNNTEGGAELDTSHCYIGKERFERMLTLLPSEAVIVGIDEHTALIMDMNAQSCQALGRGGVTFLKQNREQRFDRGQTFSLAELGTFHSIQPQTGIQPDVREHVCTPGEDESDSKPTAQVMKLVNRREEARLKGDWAAADSLHNEILTQGWQVNDIPDGPMIVKK